MKYFPSEILVAICEGTSGLIHRQLIGTLNEDNLPDRAEIVLCRFTKTIYNSPTARSGFCIINEYTGWLLVRQSFCNTGRGWFDLSGLRVSEF